MYKQLIAVLQSSRPWEKMALTTEYLLFPEPEVDIKNNERRVKTDSRVDRGK